MNTNKDIILFGWFAHKEISFQFLFHGVLNVALCLFFVFSCCPNSIVVRHVSSLAST